MQIGDLVAMASRVMSLTPELVARCHRLVEDSGPLPGLNHLTDGDYEELVDQTLATRPDHSPLWLFAYGSLIWKPEIEHLDERVAMLRGWHRSFCINQPRWRGTPERPGLMMGLDRGGACKGVAFRLPDAEPREQLARLFRREMTVKPATYMPRWLRLETEDGAITALGFTVSRRGWAYAGRFGDEDTARKLATACGHWGSCADYLYNTVANLESRGIHDRYLWRLQELVATEVRADDSAVATAAAG
jgi:cation transport protein ChaC